MFSFLPRSSGGFLADLHLRGYIHSQTPPTPDPWGSLSAMVDRISWWSQVSRHRISPSADVPSLLLLVLANNKNVKKRRSKGGENGGVERAFRGVPQCSRSKPADYEGVEALPLRLRRSGSQGKSRSLAQLEGGNSSS